MELIAKTQKDHKIGFLFLTKKLNSKTTLFLDEIKSYLNNEKFIYSDNILELNDCQKIFLVTFPDLISLKQLDSKIELLKFQSFDIEGWIFVE